MTSGIPSPPPSDNGNLGDDVFTSLFIGDIHDGLALTGAAGGSIVTVGAGVYIVHAGFVIAPVNPLAGGIIIVGGTMTAGAGLFSAGVTADAAASSFSSATGAGAHH